MHRRRDAQCPVYSPIFNGYRPFFEERNHSQSKLGCPSMHAILTVPCQACFNEMLTSRGIWNDDIRHLICESQGNDPLGFYQAMWDIKKEIILDSHFAGRNRVCMRCYATECAQRLENADADDATKKILTMHFCVQRNVSSRISCKKRRAKGRMGATSSKNRSIESQKMEPLRSHSKRLSARRRARKTQKEEFSYVNAMYQH